MKKTLMLDILTKKLRHNQSSILTRDWGNYLKIKFNLKIWTHMFTGLGPKAPPSMSFSPSSCDSSRMFLKSLNCVLYRIRTRKCFLYVWRRLAILVAQSRCLLAVVLSKFHVTAVLFYKFPYIWIISNHL